MGRAKASPTLVINPTLTPGVERSLEEAMAKREEAVIAAEVTMGDEFIAVRLILCHTMSFHALLPIPSDPSPIPR